MVLATTASRRFARSYILVPPMANMGCPLFVDDLDAEAFRGCLHHEVFRQHAKVGGFVDLFEELFLDLGEARFLFLFFRVPPWP